MKILSAEHHSPIPNTYAGQISDFSAWGVTPDLQLAPDVAAPGGYSDTNANYFKALVEEYGLLRALFLFPDRIVRNTKIGRASSPKNERGLIDDNPKCYRR